MEVSCAILAGGRSRRMGQDKAMVQVGDMTLLEHTYTVAKRVFSDILIVSSFHNQIPGLHAPIVRDVVPIPGSLTGIVSALLSARTPYVFVLGCDMPFVSEQAIRHVINEGRGESIIIPKTSAGYEPIHAIYHRCCISTMLKAVHCGHMKIGRLLPFFSTREVPEDPVFFNDGVSVFVNVNTREDLLRAQRAFQ